MAVWSVFAASCIFVTGILAVASCQTRPQNYLRRGGKSVNWKWNRDENLRKRRFLADGTIERWWREMEQLRDHRALGSLTPTEKVPFASERHLPPFDSLDGIPRTFEHTTVEPPVQHHDVDVPLLREAIIDEFHKPSKIELESASLRLKESAARASKPSHSNRTGRNEQIFDLPQPAVAYVEPSVELVVPLVEYADKTESQVDSVGPRVDYLVPSVDFVEPSVEYVPEDNSTDDAFLDSNVPTEESVVNERKHVPAEEFEQYEAQANRRFARQSPDLRYYYPHDGYGALQEQGPPLEAMPVAQFRCEQHAPGYYVDVSLRCQVFHICHDDGRRNSFLCPVGTLFSQEYLVCDWWYNVNCGDGDNYYGAESIRLFSTNKDRVVLQTFPLQETHSKLDSKTGSKREHSERDPVSKTDKYEPRKHSNARQRSEMTNLSNKAINYPLGYAILLREYMKASSSNSHTELLKSESNDRENYEHVETEIDRNEKTIQLAYQNSSPLVLVDGSTRNTKSGESEFSLPQGFVFEASGAKDSLFEDQSKKKHKVPQYFGGLKPYMLPEDREMHTKRYNRHSVDQLHESTGENSSGKKETIQGSKSGIHPNARTIDSYLQYTQNYDTETRTPQSDGEANFPFAESKLKYTRTNSGSSSRTPNVVEYSRTPGSTSDAFEEKIRTESKSNKNAQRGNDTNTKHEKGIPEYDAARSHIQASSNRHFKSTPFSVRPKDVNKNLYTLPHPAVTNSKKYGDRIMNSGKRTSTFVSPISFQNTTQKPSHNAHVATTIPRQILVHPINTLPVAKHATIARATHKPSQGRFRESLPRHNRKSSNSLNSNTGNVKISYVYLPFNKTASNLTSYKYETAAYPNASKSESSVERTNSKQPTVKNKSFEGFIYPTNVSRSNQITISVRVEGKEISRSIKAANSTHYADLSPANQNRTFYSILSNPAYLIQTQNPNKDNYTSKCCKGTDVSKNDFIKVNEGRVNNSHGGFIVIKKTRAETNSSILNDNFKGDQKFETQQVENKFNYDQQRISYDDASLNS